MIAEAHRMIIEHVDDRVIQVRYDDGTPAKLAVVTTYDADGRQLFKHEVNDEGYLDYEHQSDVHRLVANDGLGHRASSIQEDTNGMEGIPVFIRALLGVSFLSFIGAVFYVRTRKKK